MPRSKQSSSGSDLRTLFNALGRVPRADILRVLAAGPTSANSLAARIGLAEYELEEHLTDMHTFGVLALTDEGNWQLSPRVRVSESGRMLELGLNRDDNDVYQ